MKKAHTCKWAIYNEVVTVECDVCYEPLGDIALDAYDADEQARMADWYTDIEVTDNKHYDHLCVSCSEELHFCAYCEEAVWCDDALHCDDAFCSEDCLNETHLYWGTEHPGEPECPECHWENPSAAQDAVLVGPWAEV